MNLHEALTKFHAFTAEEELDEGFAVTKYLAKHAKPANKAKHKGPGLLSRAWHAIKSDARQSFKLAGSKSHQRAVNKNDTDRRAMTLRHQVKQHNANKPNRRQKKFNAYAKKAGKAAHHDLRDRLRGASARAKVNKGKPLTRGVV